jgi:putative FmdB family regulatory protein
MGGASPFGPAFPAGSVVKRPGRGRYTRRAMPTYEYVCKSCGHLFEIVQSMRDDPLTECPECAGELRKVFAPPAIAFKGSGFYATDHGKKAKTSGGDAAADKGDTKTDTAPKKDADAGTGSKDAPKATSTTTPKAKEGDR